MTNCKQYDQRKREKKSHEEKRKKGWVDKSPGGKRRQFFGVGAAQKGWVDKSPQARVAKGNRGKLFALASMI